ncbi:MAG: pentapeptide repeat-containing protein [Pikeienuella sp.]
MSENDISKQSGYLHRYRWPIRGLALIWAALVVATLFGFVKLGASTLDILNAEDAKFITGNADNASIKRAEALRWQALSFAALIAALGGLLSAPVALIRIHMNERQTKTAEEQRAISAEQRAIAEDQRKIANQQWETAEKARETAEQGLITDRFTKAIGQLGETRTVTRNGETTTEPNLEVRLGAIYALNRIAEDSERDRIPILETLCAYIRQNTNEGEAKDFPLGVYPYRWNWEGDEDLRQEYIKARPQNWQEWLTHLGPARPLRDDIATALRLTGEHATEFNKAVEGDENPKFRIDITRANLQRTDLSGANLARANASLTRLEGAELNDANLEGAKLNFAKLEGAELNGANLKGAKLNFAKLKSADLASCIFARMLARSADFTEAKNMTQEQVNAIFGDTDTKIPERGADGEKLKRTTLLNRPPLESPWDDDPEYDEWIANGAPPGVPID